MLNKLLVIILSLIFLPAFAGELENSLTAGDNVFLYLFTKNCGYCDKFNPVYKKIEKTFSNDMKFIKIDADSAYGRSLMRTFRASYVPFVIYASGKSGDAVQFAPNCLLSYSCTEKVLNKFVK